MTAMKKYILMAAAALTMWACENPESFISQSETDMVKVSVKTTLGTSGFESDSEIVPLSRAEADQTAFKLRNTYLCILTKEVQGQWIVDKIMNPTFQQSRVSGQGPKGQPIKGNETSDPLELELTPGKYRMLLVFNASMGKTNVNLYEGMVIDEDNLPYAVTYLIPAPDAGSTDNSYGNAGHHVLYGEIFTTFKEFEVNKTDSLRTDKYPREFDLTAERRVAKFRVAAVGENPNDMPSGVSFFMYYTLKTTDVAKPFCEGVDIWNGAWYNKNQKLTSIDVSQAFQDITIIRGGARYVVPMELGSRTYNPYYFIDPEDKEGTPIIFSDFGLNYQSGQPEFYGFESYESKLVNNEITGVALKVLPDFDTQQYGWWMEIVPEIDPVSLFPDNFEFNPVN